MDFYSFFFDILFSVYLSKFKTLTSFIMKPQLYLSAVRRFVGAAETSALKWKEQQRQHFFFSNSNNQLNL